jgi:predicted Kef-type K+ transport protein
MALKETDEYGIREAFTVLSAGSIGMIATPGGIGAYALLLKQTMIVYGLNKGVALAFGWILWLAQTAVILIGGLISFVAMPYYHKQKHREAS